MHREKRFIMSANDNTNGKKPEDEAKALSFEKAKKNAVAADGKKEATLKTKRKISVGWVLGMIILILIAVSFVMAPAIEAVVGKKTSNGIVFGTYGKEQIKYAYGNYFYDEVQNYADKYKSSGTDQTQMLYQIWKSAYDSTVLFTAINQLAAKAGIIAADEVVNRAVINSGTYNKDGKFDVATYQKASAESKAKVLKSIRRSLPYQIVVSDTGSVLSSTAEAKYISDMASKGRTFRYLNLSPSLYPDTLAAQYALENKQLFYSMDLSVISTQTQDEAKALYDSIKKGETTFEDAATKSSLDSFAKNGGAVGKVFYYAVVPNFKNADDALALLGAKSGDIIGPFEANGSYSLYKLNSTPAEADYADSATLSVVKAYMASNESSIIDTYLSDLAAKVSAQAKQDGLDAAAETANLKVVDVAATPYNAGGSAYMNSFSNTDPNGMLASVLTTDTGKQMYSAEADTLLDPIKSGTSYLVLEVGKDAVDSNMAGYISMFYNYYSGSQNQQDLSQALYTSDLHKDNFLTTFLNVIIGKSK